MKTLNTSRVKLTCRPKLYLYNMILYCEMWNHVLPLQTLILYKTQCLPEQQVGARVLIDTSPVRDDWEVHLEPPPRQSLGRVRKGQVQGSAIPPLPVPSNRKCAYTPWCLEKITNIHFLKFENVAEYLYV